MPRPRGCPSPEAPAILPGASPAPPRQHPYERGVAHREGVPMARPSRALARRARRLLGSWRSERRTLRQGLVALALSTLAGFVAGLTVAHLTEPLATFPGLLILIPAAVGMKGTIFGAIGARLGTASASGVLTLDL